MDPESFVEQVKLEAENRSLHLIPVNSTRTEGFSVDPEHVDEVAKFAEERDLPLLLNERLDPEKKEGATLEPTRHAHLYVQGSNTSFRVKVSSR